MVQYIKDIIKELSENKWIFWILFGGIFLLILVFFVTSMSSCIAPYSARFERLLN